MYNFYTRRERKHLGNEVLPLLPFCFVSLDIFVKKAHFGIFDFCLNFYSTPKSAINPNKKEQGFASLLFSLLAE